MIRTLLFALFFACAELLAGPPPAQAQARAASPAFERVVHDLCHRRLALIGEATHGDGTTEAFKVELVQALVDRCGYRAVLFEASRYEFADLNRRLAVGEAIGSADLAEAVGGLWNADVAFQPMLPFLADRARRRRIVLGGLDYQLGSRNAHYELDRLPLELTAALPAARATECRTIFHQRMWSDYPQPYGRADHDRVLACLADVRASLLRPPLGRGGRMWLEMADGFRDWITSDLGTPAEQVRARDAAMAAQALRLVDRLPAGTKVIVWTATVHAARIGAIPGEVPMGQILAARFGGRMFALGFSAAGGSYRWDRLESRPVPLAAAGSLERRALGSGTDVGYLDRTALSAAGTANAGALRHSPAPRRWSDVLDGLVVFREERPSVRQSVGS